MVQALFHALKFVTILLIPCDRNGLGFQELYQSNAVQKFLNMAASKSLNEDKAIYQPGSLRIKKVSILATLYDRYKNALEFDTGY